MTQLEELEQEAYEQNVPVDYVNFKSDKIHGLYVDGSIALKSGMTSAKTADILAEELEHHYTSVGNILDQSRTNNRKQENIARLRAYNRRIGLSGIIKGYQHHCCNRFELAEYLGVSEDTLRDALALYQEKYGTCVEMDGYIILFNPSLIVIEKYNRLFD